MTTDVDRVLRDTLGEYLAATVPGIVEELKGRDRDTLAFTSLGLGVQFGLELSQLDPTVARALITAIHESVADPEAATEHNSQALIFLQLVARRCAG